MAIKNGVLLAAAVEVGLISSATVSELTLRARREQLELIDLVCLHGRFPPASLYQAVAEYRQLRFIAAGCCTVDLEAIRKLPMGLMQRSGMMPVLQHNEPLLWIADPDDVTTLESARRLIGASRPLAMGEPDAIFSLLAQWQRQHQPTTDNPAPEAALDFIALLDSIFKQAYLSNASDIHFEPAREHMRVRLRVDGRLRDYPRLLSIHEGHGLISRTKVLADMDISETREPQDGSLRHQIGKLASFDVRVATAPTRFGERATLRLMGDNNTILTLEKLGMHSETLHGFRQAIRRPHGIVLITGPTGSGKSTTLYAALSELVSPEVNVLTVEDPVERVLEGVSQVQVGSKLSFAGALRAFLRHDPDVIMVGEIRDLDTADVALKAATTGHMVFSTLHTNSAAAAVTRLLDLGVERFMVGATLTAVIAQRLVRRLCPRCKQNRPANEQEQTLLRLAEVAQPIGCAACNGSGWRGRLGLFETLWIDSTLAQLITTGTTEQQLQQQAQYFESLWQDGKRKIAQGLTTLDEVLSVTLAESEQG